MELKANHNMPQFELFKFLYGTIKRRPRTRKTGGAHVLVYNLASLTINPTYLHVE